ncbi:23S ribosomal RNA methyltransferase Erm [Desmospora activa]|uniref:rRNA adenine N-6-methyltransferase n=1 Tax=Desmospora activa DSM 45169 TaxID=1121389 RepID=A0A2T4ZCC0_9BACL|nr:23S ribosomal RNA methyltransferase Erm [Desmospora activa]PTM59534.1 23S rRNA (adenine-N6)-dimethyltransferase [Desmospora activa DSM 45169]
MNKQDKRHRRIRKFRQGTNFPGQHLMHNKRLLNQLVEMAQIQPDETVVDIGAGMGALTLPLADIAERVLAVENDPILAEKLQQKVKQDSKTNIKIIQRDFLQIHLPQSPYCVVANIPYSITTPILGKLLDLPTSPFQRAVIVMEKGAAKRFTTVAITNPRILKWRMWFDLKMGQTISPDQFSPPPRVDSAVLTVCRKKKPLVSPRHHSRFIALASQGLRHAQSPISVGLRDIFTPPQINHLAKELGLNRDTQIGRLNEEQWGLVFHTMLQHVPSFRWPRYKRKDS